VLDSDENLLEVSSLQKHQRRKNLERERDRERERERERDTHTHTHDTEGRLWASAFTAASFCQN
jgi:hypothetical protein